MDSLSYNEYKSCLSWASVGSALAAARQRFSVVVTAVNTRVGGTQAQIGGSVSPNHLRD